MKQTVQMKKIQEKMRPGVITLSGFLGDDRRNLNDIIQDDAALVDRLGLTHRALAERMMVLRDRGLDGLGEFIDVPPHFEVKVDTVRGKLPCPFGDPGIFPKTNTAVRNKELNKEITYTDLNIHMILAHGFYQGKGSLFRLNPEDLSAILEVEKVEDPETLPTETLG